MAGEGSADSSRQGHEVSRATGLTISPTSQKLQALGQRILNNRHIVEVTENIFSTCQVPLRSLTDRLLLARDFGAPLVEATVLPKTDKNAEIKQLFGVSRLVESILWSDGKQRDDGYVGDHIRYDHMALRLDDDETNVERCGDSGNEIQSYIISSIYTFSSMDNSHFHSLGMAYEDMIVHGFMPTDDPRIDLELDRASELLERFDAARTPDGYWK